MKLGIVADVHANIQALEVVFERIAEEGAEQTVCLGDVVGYGGNPSACIRAMRQRGLFSISGNHDLQITGPINPATRGPALKSLRWTREVLSKDDWQYLIKLPEKAVVDEKLLLVHGSPRHRDEYVATTESMKQSLALVDRDYDGVSICLHGHTHVPAFIDRRKAIRTFGDRQTLALEPEETYLINPGSVGQPRDKCPKASFCVLDTDAPSVTFVRAEYDIYSAQQSILSAKLPSGLATRLAHGV